MHEFWINWYEYIKKSNQIEQNDQIVLMYEILGCRWHSSATVERSFSVLNCIKTFKRNKMKNKLLNKLLRIKNI